MNLKNITSISNFMKLKLLFVAVALGIGVAAAAQTAEMPKYQRSSLHMVLMKTNEEALKGTTDYTPLIQKYWKNYPFPDKYNKHDVAIADIDAGTPKASMMALINKYGKNINSLDIAEAKALMAGMTKGSEYKQSLVDTLEINIAKNKVGNQLIRKWFNIKDDGSWDYDLIMERAEYNANQADIAKANATTRGIRAICDDGEELISNTFVTFSKISFYESEPVAAFVRDLAKFIGSFTGPAAAAAYAAADVAYTATKDGYTAKTTTALYKLEWTEEIKGEFYAMFKEDGKIDMQKFNDFTFPMTLVGIDDATSSTFNAQAGFAESVGAQAKKPAEDVIQQTIVRNIDKILAKMQRTYEVFAPVSQIISTDPVLLADMGMKEGLEGGESFNLLQPTYNEKTNKVEWKSVGVVKVDKKQIWDNRYALTDEAKKAAEESEVKGTVLSANKKAVPGMVVRQVVKAAKKK